MVTYDKGCRTELCHWWDGGLKPSDDLRVWTQHQECLKGTRANISRVSTVNKYPKYAILSGSAFVMQCQDKLTQGFFLFDQISQLGSELWVGFWSSKGENSWIYQSGVWGSAADPLVVHREDRTGWDQSVSTHHQPTQSGDSVGRRLTWNSLGLGGLHSGRGGRGVWK